MNRVSGCTNRWGLRKSACSIVSDINSADGTISRGFTSACLTHQFRSPIRRLPRMFSTKPESRVFFRNRPMPFDVAYELLWPRLDGHGARPDVDLLSWPQTQNRFCFAHSCLAFLGGIRHRCRGGAHAPSSSWLWSMLVYNPAHYAPLQDAAETCRHRAGAEFRVRSDNGRQNRCPDRGTAHEGVDRELQGQLPLSIQQEQSRPQLLRQ